MEVLILLVSLWSLIVSPLFQLQFFRTEGKMAFFHSKVLSVYIFYTFNPREKNANPYKAVPPASLPLLGEILRLSSKSSLLRLTLAARGRSAGSLTCL